jgi:ABC-type transporter Mla subunit MlaD
VLKGEREELGEAIELLADALIEVRKLLRENRTTLRHNVDNLARLAKVLARHNEDIEHTLIDAPVALGDLGLAGGSPKTGTLDARADIGALLGSIKPEDLPGIICSQLGDPIPPGEQLCPILKNLLDTLLPDDFALAGLPGGDAAGTAEQKSPDKTADSLQEQLGVNP